MIDLPSARLRLRKFVPEIEAHVDGIDYQTFKHYLMQVCTTDSHQFHNIDEASIAIANLLGNIRKHVRNDRARHLTQSKKQPIVPRRPAGPPVRIARVPTSITQRNKNSKKMQPSKTVKKATGVHAFGHDVEEDKNGTCCRKCFKKFLDVVRDEFILVDQMHIPALLVLLWLVVGTTLYTLIQQWSVAQSFYFMVQASRPHARLAILSRTMVPDWPYCLALWYQIGHTVSHYGTRLAILPRTMISTYDCARLGRVQRRFWRPGRKLFRAEKHARMRGKNFVAVLLRGCALL